MEVGEEETVGVDEFVKDIFLSFENNSFKSIFFLALGVLGFLGYTTCKYGYQLCKDYWSIWYYVFAIIGSVATTAAVIVALLKEEILHKFHFC